MTILEELSNHFVKPLWNEQALEVIDNFIAPHADIRTTFVVGKGPAAMKESVVDTFKAFPVFEMNIEAIIQQGSKVTYK